MGFAERLPYLTVFIIHFTLIEARNRGISPNRRGAMMPPPTMAAKRIVVADDDDTLTDLLNYLLSREGYEVTVANDGQETIDLLKSSRPNLLILDLDMPSKGGFEVLSEMVHRDEFQGTGVIILSGREKEEDVQRALAMGGLAFFVKPFNSVELVQKVKLILGRDANG